MMIRRYCTNKNLQEQLFSDVNHCFQMVSNDYFLFFCDFVGAQIHTQTQADSQIPTTKIMTTTVGRGSAVAVLKIEPSVAAAAATAGADNNQQRAAKTTAAVIAVRGVRQEKISGGGGGGGGGNIGGRQQLKKSW